MLCLSDLSIGYPGRPLQKHLSASLPQASLTAIVGRNGTGKSTLLRTLAGLLAPLFGEVWLGEERLSQLSPQMMAHRLALVLTTRIEAPALRVSELVALGRLPHHRVWQRSSAADRTAIDQAIQLTQLEPLLHREVSSLSDGERQRAMIARALAQDTPFLLLDEPTAFLDHPTKQAILQLLRRIAHQGQKTVLLSSHDLALTLPEVDQLWLLTTEGLLTGSPQDLAEAMNREFALP